MSEPFALSERYIVRSSLMAGDREASVFPELWMALQVASLEIGRGARWASVWDQAHDRDVVRIDTDGVQREWPMDEPRTKTATLDAVSQYGQSEEWSAESARKWTLNLDKVTVNCWRAVGPWRDDYPDAARDLARAKGFASKAPTFEEAWSEKESLGYKYGEDALQGVRFGWEMRGTYGAGEKKSISDTVTLRAGDKFNVQTNTPICVGDVILRAGFDTSKGFQELASLCINGVDVPHEEYVGQKLRSSDIIVVPVLLARIEVGNY